MEFPGRPVADSPASDRGPIVRVLVVAPEPFFTPRGTPFSVYYRTLALAEQGIACDLLTYGEGEDVDIPGLRHTRIPNWRPLRQVPVGPSLKKAWLDVFLFAWTFGFLVRRRYDFVHAHEESVFFLLPLKTLFRFKLVYDMHSSLPEQLMSFGFTRSRLIVDLFRWLEGRALRRSDAVVTIDRALSDYARARMTDPTRHILIENSPVAEIRLNGRRRHIDAPSRTASVTAPEAVLRGGGPIICYAGNFEQYQGLDLLQHAFAEVVVDVPEARLLLIGGTPTQVEQHQELAAGLDLQEKVFFTGTLGPCEARRLIGSADVLVSPRVDGTNTPLKIYEQIGSGIPLVATRILAHTQVLDDEVCMLVDATSDGIARGILELLLDQQNAAELARRAQSLSQTRYGWDAYARRVRRLVAGLGLRPDPSGAVSTPPS